MTLTIAYISGREAPYFDWFMTGLNRQLNGREAQVLFISPFVAGDCPPRRLVEFVTTDEKFSMVEICRPKPTVWQGRERLTKEDYWAVSNARNTAICLARGNYIVFVDDRCILGPQWMDSVLEAVKGNYAVAGTYTKYHGLKPDGSFEKVDGEDHRIKLSKGGPCAGQWFFGCSCGLPLEWALSVNGYDEDCDGMGYEDCFFGIMLEKHGYPIRFDPRMAVLQDRTPGTSGPYYKRVDKGTSPNDKSHAMVRLVDNGRTKAPNYFGEGGIRAMRLKVLAGEPFPVMKIPEHDWFDHQPISEM